MMASPGRWLQSTIAVGLLTVSALCMWLLRVALSGSHLYQFIPWNMLLAWMPLGLAWLAWAMRDRRRIAWITGLMWLLFLPNSWYLVTDLIHLRGYAGVPVWYDALLLLNVGLCGLLLGLLSLMVMQQLVCRHWGALVGWLFVPAAMLAGSFGVFVGRFLRWNSWDLLLQPIPVALDVAAALAHRGEARWLVGATVLTQGMLLLVYLALAPLPRFPIRARQRKAARDAG